MGKAERAYMTSGNQNRPTQRSYEHALYLNGLMDKGYLPHEWTEFHLRNLEKKKALQIEHYLINKLNPKFNKKSGIPFSISKDQGNEIRKLHEEKLSYDEIAKIFKTSRTTIWRVIRNKRGEY